jgi:hypothetical protein
VTLERFEKDVSERPPALPSSTGGGLGGIRWEIAFIENEEDEGGFYGFSKS